MIYPESFEAKTGFDKIRDIVTGYCSGLTGRELAAEIKFSQSPEEVMRKVNLTWEMQQLLSAVEPVFVDNGSDIRPALEKIRIEGAYATEEELFTIRKHLDSLRSVLAYFRKVDRLTASGLKDLSENARYYPAVYDSIDRVIDKTGIIRDSASPRLREIRKELAGLMQQVTRRLHSILKSARAEGIVDADSSVSIRNGRGVIPVNVFNKRRIPGLVHDQSASGKTVYIEPAEVVELNNDIFELEYEEKREIVKILLALSDTIRPYIDDMLESAQYLAIVDFIRAKAVFGKRLGSVRPSVQEKARLKWYGARHPLLYMAFEKIPDRHVVPLDLSLDEETRIIVISGPNAGGKSVCLKTVGLLQYMLQCGFTIPVLEGSEAGIFSDIFIDIGDEQSIENDLSTYSSHLQAMKTFMKHSGPETLVLIDEFGAGTEPVLGGALAEAILAELNRRSVFGIVTTHYTNLKHFASNTPGIVNGAMSFDNHLMQPLFKLMTGRPGSSFAFEIARKIGLPDNVLGEASEKAGKENIVYDKFLRDIARDRRYWEKKRETIRRQEKRLEEMAAEYEADLNTIRDKKKEIITAARKEAEELLSGANRIIEGTVREIREAEAEKVRTREARRKLDEFRENLRTKDPADNMPVRKSPLKPKKNTEKRVEEKKSSRQKIEAGTYVKMAESDTAGLVEDITDNIAVVSFGNVVIKLPVEKLIPSTISEFNRTHRRSSRPALDWESSARKAGFTSQLDLRGVRADEAIMKVQEFLDQAWMISYPTVRILHGKGYGILRQQIRQYLETLGYIRSFDDAPVDQGGSGITIVELDV